MRAGRRACMRQEGATRMASRARVRVMDAAAIRRALARITREIHAAHRATKGLALVGIQTRGVPLARRISAALAQLGGEAPATGLLDINLYRDDLSRIADHPVLHKTEIPFEVDDRTIVLVDDVLFTGRTVRAALDALMDLGRPKRIELAVLVDRGHRELPVCANYVGKVLKTAEREQVEVRVGETDSVDEVFVVARPGTAKAAVRRAAK